MSRPFWHVKVTAQLVNGQSGVVELEAKDLVTLRELQAVFDRAMTMCKALNTPITAEEEPAPQRPAWPRAV